MEIKIGASTPWTVIVDKGLELGIQILKRSNDQKAKAYAIEMAELKTKVFAERRKPLNDQIDSDIEKWEDRLTAIQDIAMAEALKYGKDD